MTRFFNRLISTLIVLVLIVALLPLSVGAIGTSADTEVTDRWPTDMDRSIFKNMDGQKRAILNSPTSVVVKGVRYYVSTNGNDSNNGLTPETAWATLAKVNAANDDGTLHAGDGVFFQRGGLWRGGLRCAFGVTYSAYGTGEKPKHSVALIYPTIIFLTADTAGAVIIITTLLGAPRIMRATQ